MRFPCPTVLALCATLLSGSTTARAIELLSVDPSGMQSCNAGVGETFCVSADGRLVAFTSASTNIAAPEASGQPGLFVRDCAMRSNIWSTAGSTWTAPFGFSSDARFLVFASSATNLVPGIASSFAQAYRHDFLSNQTSLVSAACDGSNAASAAIQFSTVSADGRFILLVTSATTLVSNLDSNASLDVFCRDMQARTNELITASPSGSTLDQASKTARMSEDGRYFAFWTSATNVVPGLANSNGTSQVHWRDRLAGTNTLVSVNVDGDFAKDSALLNGFSLDGRYVCFSCPSTNFAFGQNDTNGTPDILIREMMAGETWLVSRATNGNATGRYLIFSSYSSNLVVDTPTFANRLFLRDIVANRTFNTLPEAYQYVGVYLHCQLTEVADYAYYLNFKNYDPSLTDTNGRVDLFRTRLRPARLNPPQVGGTLQAEGMVNAAYLLQDSSNLVDWFTVSTDTASSNGVISISDPLPPAELRFYRLGAP